MRTIPLFLLLIALTTSSEIISPPEAIQTVQTFVFTNSEAQSFSNASLLFWDASNQPCDSLTAILSNALPKSAPRGLLVHGQPKCFPDDLARAYSDHFEFVLYFKVGSYKPYGLEAVVRWRSYDTTPIPVYETDYSATNGTLISQLTLHVSPSNNPYTTPAILGPYIAISASVILFNVHKLYKCFERLLPTFQEEEIDITAAVILLCIEAAASVCCIATFVDYDGLFGVYSTQAFYPLLNLIPFLGNLSSVVLITVYSSALAEVVETTVSHDCQMRLAYVSLLISMVSPVYDSYAIMTHQVQTSPVLTSVNMLCIMGFTLFFCVKFIAAKKYVVSILSDAKGAAMTTERKKVERMSSYMYYSALAMLLNLFCLFSLALVVVLAESGTGGVLLTGTSVCFLTLVGYTQVQSLPEPKKS